MTDNKKIAAELVANYQLPANLRERQKRADFTDQVREFLSGARDSAGRGLESVSNAVGTDQVREFLSNARDRAGEGIESASNAIGSVGENNDLVERVKEFLSGAGQTAGKYLNDPNNLALRNAAIGAGIGGTAGLVGSSKGRRIRDLLRGALLGGAAGGVGTLAWKGIQGARENLTKDNVPAEFKGMDATRPSFIGSAGEYRPLTAIGTGLAAGNEIANSIQARSPDSLSKGLSDKPGWWPFYDRGAFDNKSLNPTNIERNRVLDAYSRKVQEFYKAAPGATKAAPKAIAELEAFQQLLTKSPDDAYQLLREASNELKGSKFTPSAATMPAPQPAGVDGNAAGTISSPSKLRKRMDVKPQVAEATGFNAARSNAASHIQGSDAVKAYKTLTPSSLNQVVRRPNQSLLRRWGRRGAIGGAAGAGYLLEPTLLKGLGNASNFFSTPPQLSPEEVRRQADLYYGAQ